MKKLVICGLCGSICLLAGAFVVQKMAFEPSTISDFSGLYSLALSKGSTPPIPDIDPVAVFGKIKAKDWSFMNETWFRTESLGVAYVSKDTKELAHLDLPLTIRIYRYPPTDAVYILSSKDGTNFVSEAAFADEPLVDEAFETMSTTKQQSELLFALWDLRAVYEVTLKSVDDAWSDFFSMEQTLLSAQSVSLPQMMTMSVPLEHTNDLWLGIECQTVTVFAPEAFTNRVELYTTENLVSNIWNIAVQNLLPISTNPASWTCPLSGSSRFFRAGNMDIDSDGDDLPDAREQIVHKTNEQDSDSDNDALTDGEEVLTYGLDPNSSDTNGDGVPDAIDANMQGTTGEDGVLIVLPDGEYRHMPESVLDLNSYEAYGQ